jgi:hypothetical protein
MSDPTKKSVAGSIAGLVENSFPPLAEHATQATDQGNPNRLLDALLARMRLESDAALAHKLQVIQPIIRMMRDGSLAMKEEQLLDWIAESTDIPVAELRHMMRPR